MTLPHAERLLALVSGSVLPGWQKNGLDALAISCEQQFDFIGQGLPQGMEVTPCQRIGPRTTLRGNITFNSTSYFIHEWPKDGMRSLRYPALIYVVRGNPQIRIADYAVRCRPGHFILFRPAIAYDSSKPHFVDHHPNESPAELLRLRTYPQSNFLSLWTCISTPHSHGIGSNTTAIYPSHPLFPHALNIFFNEMLEQQENYREVAESTFEIFLRLLIEHLKPDQKTRESPYKGSQYPNEMIISEALQYIDRNLHQQLTIEKVARTAYLSRTKFALLFKQITGQTFHQYVIQQRLDLAERLLSEGMWSVDSISNRVGFTSSHLRNIFRTRYQSTPSKFKTNN